MLTYTPLRVALATLRSRDRLYALAFASIRARAPPTARPPATALTASQRALAPAAGSLTHLHARLSVRRPVH